jgi:hypothetical protein
MLNLHQNKFVLLLRVASDDWPIASFDNESGLAKGEIFGELFRHRPMHPLY